MAALEVQMSQASKDPASGFSSSRLFSKIARSPTSSSNRKQNRNNITSAASVLDQGLGVSPLESTQGAAHSRQGRNQTRPGILRQTSAPEPIHAIHQSVVPPAATETLHEQDEASVDAGPRKLSSSDATGYAASQAMSSYAFPHYAIRPPPRPSTNTSASSKDMSFAPIVSEYALPSQMAYSGGQGLNYLYQQMQELSTKRIATLEYMRKTHEGRKTFWFNTVSFTKSDISRMPSYTPNRLARRATNYMLLGMSIPAVLDMHQPPPVSTPPQTCTLIALEFLRSLNTLLAEFESYQQLHPSDGTHPGSLSRARLPSMFKRTGTTRPRKSSSAPTTDLGLGAQISPPAVPETPRGHAPQPSVDGAPTLPALTPSLTHQPSSNLSGMAGPAPSFSASAIFPPPGPPDAPNSSLIPNEQPYTHLLTPPLPFSPDFHIVFTTLCDVLIDTYQKLLQIVRDPQVCNATITEMFSKTDARLRKVMVGGIVRDFETAAREGAKRELVGVQKVVLGGLMGQ